MSVVTVVSASTPSDAPAFELHIATQERRLVDGLDQGGDPDLVAHFAVTMARGRALFGPPPADVFVPVKRSRLLRSFAEDLAWAVERGLAGYAVLNACRALRSALDEGLYSKLEGGSWALDRGIGDRALITAALRRQQGGEGPVDAEAAASFAMSARVRLLAAAASRN